MSAPDIEEDIVKQFLSCPVQQLATSTLLNEILDSEFFWETSNSSTKIPIDDPQMLLWHNLVKRITREFLLYGFVVYRTVAIADSDKGEDFDISDKVTSNKKLRPDNLAPKFKSQKLPKHKVEIKPGDTVELKFSKRSGTFVATTKGGMSKKIIAKQGEINTGVLGQWRLQLYELPLVSDSGVVSISSAAARAFGSSVAHSQMVANALERDSINTEPTVYTTLSDRIKAGNSGVNTKPWFDAAGPNSSVTARPGRGGSALDFDQLVADRLDSISALQQMSNTARQETERIYATAAVGSRSLHTPPSPIQKHSEMMITDGFVPQELSFRRAPEDFLQLLEKFKNDILFQFNTPPQILG